MATMDELFGDGGDDSANHQWGQPSLTHITQPSTNMTMDIIPSNNEEGTATMADLFGEDDAEANNGEQGVVTVTDLFGEEGNEEEEEEEDIRRRPLSTTTIPITHVHTNQLSGTRTSPTIARRTGGNIVSAHGKMALHLPAFPRLSSSHSSSVTTTLGSATSSTSTPSLDTYKKVSLVRLPRIVGISPNIYDNTNYNEAEEDEYLAEADKVAAKEALIRYRLKTVVSSSSSASSSSSTQTQYVTDAAGRPQRESNSRVVEWSDGSLTLHVGAEVFSLRRANKASDKNDTNPATTSSGGGGDYNYIYSLVNSVNPDTPHSSSSSGRSTKETLLESQAVVSNRLVAGAVAGSGIINQSVLEQRASRSRAVKRSRVTQISLTEDPELEKQRRIKQEEELQRLRISQKRKAEDAQRKSGGAYDKDIYGTGGDDDAMMDENEGGEETVNLGALKKNSRNNRKKPVAKPRYTSDDEDSDDDDDSDDDSNDDSSDSSDE